MMYLLLVIDLFVFFFQAEDGIRDGHVTGVQTCALPICSALERATTDSPAVRPASTVRASASITSSSAPAAAAAARAPRIRSATWRRSCREATTQIGRAHV